METLSLETHGSSILGSQGIDNVVVALEVIYSMLCKLGKKGWFAAKLDLAKAYDHFDWSFLRCVLQAVRFNSKMIQLFVLWNREKLESFKP